MLCILFYSVLQHFVELCNTKCNTKKTTKMIQYFTPELILRGMFLVQLKFIKRNAETSGMSVLPVSYFIVELPRIVTAANRSNSVLRFLITIFCNNIRRSIIIYLYGIDHSSRISSIAVVCVRPVTSGYVR